jgi:hypothetical protein
MKSSITLLIIISTSLLSFGQTPAVLGFPLGLKSELSFVQLKAHMQTKSFDSEKKWKERGTGVDSNKFFDRTESLWKESDLYRDFTKDYNLKEYSYSGISPKVGSTKPAIFTAFFSDDKLAAIAIILSPITSYEEMLITLQTKYGSPTNQETFVKNQGNLFTIWGNKSTKIQLNSNNPKGNNQISIEYIDLHLLDNAKNAKPKGDSIDY